MKKIVFIIVLALLCMAACFFSGHNNSVSDERPIDTAEFSPTVEVQEQKPAKPRITDSVITKTYEEFEQRTRIEHINAKKLRANMIGAHMYANCKPENFKMEPNTAKPNKFVIDVYARRSGAFKFYGCKVLIGEKVYEIAVDQAKSLGGGSFVGACLVKVYSDDILEPLARASSAKVKYLFDNGDYEATLSKKDLRVFSDMYSVFLAHGGEIKSY